jgi:hypothetical protein
VGARGRPHDGGGIVWHVITQETENDHVLDSGTLGPQRKLYYKELIARFAHAPALIWNLGEENDNTPDERIAFADYIRAMDPYDHPIALHNRTATSRARSARCSARTSSWPRCSAIRA